MPIGLLRHQSFKGAEVSLQLRNCFEIASSNPCIVIGDLVKRLLAIGLLNQPN